jgi:hypothetical protein
MKTTLQKIEEIKRNGFQFNFENTFELALENYKKIALYAGLTLLVFITLFFGILFAGLFWVYDFQELMENLRLLNENPQAVPVIFSISYYFSIVIFACIYSPFTAGFFKMADCGQKGEEFKVASMFEFYKVPYLYTIILSTLIIATFTTGFTYAFTAIGYSFVGSLISIIISFLTLLTIPFIVFGKLNAVDAIQSSAIVVSKKPFVMLGLLIVAGIFSLLGIIGCGVGVFFTIPFIYSMTYAIYKLIIGIDSAEQNENTETVN